MDYNYGRSSPTGNRRRSASEPQSPRGVPAIRTSGIFDGVANEHMTPVKEETSHTIPEGSVPQQNSDLLAPAATTGRLRSASNAARGGLKRMSSKLSNISQPTQKGDDYETEVTDLLDVVGKTFYFFGFVAGD